MMPPPVPPVYRQTNHTFHLIASFCTCGAWLCVWPAAWAVNGLVNGMKRRDYDRQNRAFWAGQVGGHS